MTVELTFWQEYGPRLAMAVVLLIVGGGLFLLGGGAARAYEKAGLDKARHYLAMSGKRRVRQKPTVVSAVEELMAKASKARTLEEMALYVTCAGLVALAVRTALDSTAWSVGSKWAVTAVVVVVVQIVLMSVVARARTARRARLEDVLDLGKEDPSP